MAAENNAQYGLRVPQLRVSAENGAVRPSAPANVHPSAEEEYFRGYTDDLWELVLRLPVRYREVLVLHARYAMDEGGIARLLGLPAGTVKSRLHRARKKMSTMLKEGADHERT
ncbi:sigma-70 region 4 domain-containing protein [Paenibacillus flagellatus]|uniref:RNA polymerase sigma factor n=1 Tax=Paenibacillus flagellatus TaxID=2211139 RepID=UPI00319DAF78